MTKVDTFLNQSGELALYITDCSAITDDGLLSAYKTWLSDAEHKRMERFTLEQEKKRFLVSRALIREVLAAETGFSPEDVVLTTSAAGKPTHGHSSRGSFVPDFNLTHTGTLCVLAINRQGQVGVDMEDLDREVACLEIARRYFRKEEAEALEMLDKSQQQERFVELWTLKEAFIKKCGLGIAGASLDSIGIDFHEGEICLHDEARIDRQTERFYRFRYSYRFHIALAYEAEADLPVTCFRMIPGDSVEQLEQEISVQSLRLLT